MDRGAHRLELRLCNEHRHYLHQEDADFDWDEVILDRASWTWSLAPDATLTIGRQDIIWDRGFLMLEGHPLDGSRSMYHNAARYTVEGRWGRLDVAAIRNPTHDPIVLVDDEYRRLTDGDETALAARLARGGATCTVIWKDEDDPDRVMPRLRTLTVAGGYDGDMGGARVVAELALQRQHGASVIGGDRSDRWALAMTTAASGEVGRRFRGEVGCFYYSGARGELAPFRTPWGRWPKWSDLYIYSLIDKSNER